MPHLGQVLAAVLAHDPEQWGEFHRHFGAFFVAESYGELRPHPLDRPALVAALGSLQVEPAPSTPTVTRTVTLKAADAHVAATAADASRSVSPSTPAAASAPRPESPASTPSTPAALPTQSPPPTLFRIRETTWPESLPAPASSRPHLDWDPAGPRQFFLADVGPPPEPLLSSSLLDHLADTMGYFRSQRLSAPLHVDDTIRETVRAGYPVLRFLPGWEVCRLLLLEDTWAEARAWNTVPQELAEGLTARGVPVTRGLFDGQPVRFRLADGSAVCDLEDWEDQRAGLLVLLFTEGKGFYRRRDARVLEDLACWPRLA